VIDDETIRGVQALEADGDLPVGQVKGSFEAPEFEGERVVGAALSGFLSEEEFVVGFIGREVAHAGEVKGKAIPKQHANRFHHPLYLSLEASKGFQRKRHPPGSFSRSINCRLIDAGGSDQRCCHLAIAQQG